ncbi:MAG TPA: TIR domain-containing protein [Thermoanaerobaculia bacterium]
MSESTPQGVVPAQDDGRPKPAPEAVYDVFLSYNSKDRKVVQRIGRELEKRGMRVWADWKMPSGSVWLTELEKIIRQVRVAAFFVGPSGMGEWHDTERQAFHIRRACIIPVLLPGAPADFEPPLFLHRHSWIDFRTPGKITKKELDRLVEGIRADAAAAEAEAAAGLEAVLEEPATEPAGPRARLSRRAVALSALTLLLALAGGLTWLKLRPEEKTAAKGSASPARPSRWKAKVPLPRPSVAVLSFESRAPGGDQGWLATALAEVVSAKLGMGGAALVADRFEVSRLESDLLLPRKAEVSAQDLSRIHRLLGVDFVVGGAYAPVGGTPTARLDLTFYDARKGRRLAQASETGEAAAWFDLADRASEGSSEKGSFRHRLGVAPLILEQKRSLRSLFPTDLQAAQLYAQGLDRYRRFDRLSAADLFARAAKLEPHPLVLANLADVEHSLGRSKEAAAAVETAKRRAPPGEHRRRVELIGRKVSLDRQGAAEMSEALFREYFPDDLGYGLQAVTALLDAGSAEDALLLIGELRDFPSAERHPAFDRAEARAFLQLQRYGKARAGAERALKEAHGIGALHQEALARLLLASTFSMMGQAPQAEEQLRAARSGFERTGDLLGVAKCVELTGLLYVNLDLETAAGLYRETIERYDSLGARADKARVLFGLSGVLSRQGDDSAAEKLSVEATALASQSSASLSEGLAEFLEGYRLHVAGQLTAAQARYEAARVIFGKVNQRDHYATTLTNLGEIEHLRGRLANAEELHHQALKIHEAGGGEGAAYDNVCLGRTQAAAGNYFAARQQYDRALRRLQPAAGGSPPEPETLVEALLAMAELELLTGKPGKAEERAREAAEVADGAGQNALRSRARALLARALLDQRKIDAARKVAKEAADLAHGDFRSVRESQIAGARARAAAGEVDAALQALEKVAAETGKAGLVVYEMESLLAAGEIEMADGRLNPARRRLEALQTRAAGLGYGQMEKRAAAALGL